MNIIGIIPARYASTRFPGKPLHPIAGKPLIAHVVERCREAASLAPRSGVAGARAWPAASYRPRLLFVSALSAFSMLFLFSLCAQYIRLGLTYGAEEESREPDPTRLGTRAHV